MGGFYLLPVISQTSRLTEVDVQKGSVGSLHQDLLAGSSERFVHEVYTISHQRAQFLSISLKRSMGNFLRPLHAVKNVLELNVKINETTTHW